MKKLVKNTIALLMCLLMGLSVTACHKQNEVALTMNGINYTSAYYSCALVFADSEAKQRVSGSVDSSTAELDYSAQTIDGVKYNDWVKNKAIAICKDNTAYRLKCQEAGLDITELAKEYEENATVYWSYYGFSEVMQQNGVSLNTFNNYFKDQAYKEVYFNSIYGENGSNAIADSEITDYLNKNYVIANVLSADLSKLNEEEKAKKLAEFEGYKNKIAGGEKFAKISAEFYGTTYTEDAEKPAFDYEQASIIGNTGTTYASNNFEYVKDMANDEVKVVEIKADTEKNVTPMVYLFFKGDILSEDNINLADLKTAVRHDIKDAEFSVNMKEFIASVTVDENKYATKQFKVDKIVYPS